MNPTVALPSCGRSRACELSPMAYWVDAVTGPACPEGFWSSALIGRASFRKRVLVSPVHRNLGRRAIIRRLWAGFMVVAGVVSTPGTPSERVHWALQRASPLLAAGVQYIIAAG